MGLERVGGTGEDRLDRPRRHPRAEQLVAALHDIAARDAVSHRQRGHRRLQPGPERARTHPGRQLARLLAPTARAANALAAVLDHPRRQPRQLLDLMARRNARRDTIPVSEHMPATAPRRPMIDDRVDRPCRQQLAPTALMARLGALTVRRPALRPRRPRPRRLGRRRPRRVPRVASQLTLKTLDTALQPADLAIHPQQHLHDRLTTSVIDRLRLDPLHTPNFNAQPSCPPNQLNAYQNPRICRGSLERAREDSNL